MTVSDAADLVGVSCSTVYRWIKNGKLPGTRIGSSRFVLVSIEQVQELIKKNKYRDSITAAAPDLLEACEVAHFAVGSYSHPNRAMIDAVHKLEAAIAKAKGGCPE